MMIVLVTADNYLLMFVGPFLALYIRNYINYISINCWDIFNLKLKAISRDLKWPSETKHGIPSLDYCKGKEIVQSFMWIKKLLRLSHNLHIFFDIYTPSCYYISLPFFILKRLYSSKNSKGEVEISKFSNKYKQEYDLTQEQSDVSQHKLERINKKDNNLNSYFVTGLYDGEGCFIISIAKKILQIRLNSYTVFFYRFA